MLGHLLWEQRAQLELIIHFSPNVFILFAMMILFLICLALVLLGPVAGRRLPGVQGPPSEDTAITRGTGCRKARGGRPRLPPARKGDAGRCGVRSAGLPRPRAASSRAGSLCGLGPLSCPEWPLALTPSGLAISAAFVPFHGPLQSPTVVALPRRRTPRWEPADRPAPRKL